MLSVEDWAEIRRLHRAEGLPIKMIARVMGMSAEHGAGGVGRRTRPPRYVRRPARSIVDAVEPRIRELLKAFPTMPATVIAERVGWTRGMTVFADRVRELRPVYLPPDPAEPDQLCGGRDRPVRSVVPGRSSCRSGSARSALPAQLPVLTMVCGYSRWLSARADPVAAAPRTCSPGWWQHVDAAGGGAAGDGVGRRERGRPLARRAAAS